MPDTPEVRRRWTKVVLIVVLLLVLLVVLLTTGLLGGHGPSRHGS